MPVVAGRKELVHVPVHDCDKCGWAADEERRRKDYVRRYGLRTGKDGLRYIPARPEKE